MALAWGWRITVLVLGIVTIPILSHAQSFSESDHLHCEHVVRNWVEQSLETDAAEGKSVLKDLLFFLHVPRTGGRSYFHCFLRKIYKQDQECPRSYDKLRFDPSKSKCRVLVTHDDYSLMSKLPKERTSVVTILRNPVDRVFSTYEFSMEVAARFLVHPNLTSAVQMSIRIRPKAHGVSTLDIWPWKYLVPWMREDLFARRDARRQRASYIAGNGNPYDMKEIVMPLQDFINEPIAHDIVHNGATFQVAGLTNNSVLPGSQDVRHCVSKHPALGHYVLEVAKRRLDNMLYVGLTEEHKKSATMFANMVGAQVLSQSEFNTPEEQQSTTTYEHGISVPDVDLDEPNQLQSSITEKAAQNASSSEEIIQESRTTPMTVHKLIDSYENCTTALRRTQARRRKMSLETVAPANFTKDARNMVPEGIIRQILLLNNLDVELYEHAQHIFMQQKKHLNREILHSENEAKQLQGKVLNWRTNLYKTCTPNKTLLISATLVVSVCILWYLTVIMRRRTSKLKV